MAATVLRLKDSRPPRPDHWRSHEAGTDSRVFAASGELPAMCRLGGSGELAEVRVSGSYECTAVMPPPPNRHENPTLTGGAVEPALP